MGKVTSGIKSTRKPPRAPTYKVETPQKNLNIAFEKERSPNERNISNTKCSPSHENGDIKSNVIKSSFRKGKAKIKKKNSDK